MAEILTLEGFAFRDSKAHERIDNIENRVVNYNVAEFGAIGDGLTDDTESIRQVITEANKTGGNVIFKKGATYLVNEKTPIEVKCSIDFNGATIKPVTCINNGVFRILPESSCEIVIDHESITNHRVNDSRLFGKTFNVVTPVFLGVRNNSTEEFYFQQQMQTDNYGNFINGKLNIKIIEGDYVCKNVQGITQLPLNVHGVKLDFSGLPLSDKTASVFDFRRSNVKLFDVTIIGKHVTKDWAGAILSWHECSNIEIYNVYGTSPFDTERGGKAYVFGLYNVSDVYMHDCRIGGGSTTWGSMCSSFIANFTAERVRVMRFDCHYYYNGHFTVRDSFCNFAYFCGGNGNWLFDNVEIRKEEPELYALTRRNDLCLFPSGNIIYRNCKFSGVTNTLAYFNTDNNIVVNLEDILYDKTNFIIENCKIESDSVIGFVRWDTDYFNLYAKIKDTDGIGNYIARSMRESNKIKEVIIDGINYLDGQFPMCSKVVIKDCDNVIPNFNNADVDMMIVQTSVLSPTKFLYAKCKNLLIVNNFITTDFGLSVNGSGGQSYIVNNNVITANTRENQSYWLNVSGYNE